MKKFKGRIGIVQSLGDGVIQVSGMEKGKLGELVLFQNGDEGLILELGFKTVGVVIFGKDDIIRVGDFIVGLDRILRVPAGSYVQGRVVNALGNFVDGLE